MTVEAVARGDHHTLMQLATRRHKQQVRESAWHRRLRRGVERRVLAASEAAGRARREGLVFDHNSSFIFSWGVVIVVGALYSSVFLPLALVFPESRWRHHRAVSARGVHVSTLPPP